MIVSWTNPGEDTPVDDNIINDVKSKYFPSGFVGAATIEADNISQGTSGTNDGLIATSHAAPLDVDVAFVVDATVDTDDIMGLDRIGVSGCDDCRYNNADIIVTVEDAKGTPVVGVNVELTLSSLTHGRFADLSDPDSATVSTVDAGKAVFSSDDAFDASKTSGTATFTGTVLGATFEAELLVTGAPAELVLATSRVDRSSTTDLADVKDLGADLFSVGLTDTDSTASPVDVGTDIFIVYVTILDADGNKVDAKAPTPIPSPRWRTSRTA